SRRPHTILGMFSSCPLSIHALCVHSRILKSARIIFVGALSMCLLGCDGVDGLLQPLRAELEIVEPAGGKFLPGGARGSAGPWEAGGVQYRSGFAVHECDVCESTA